jgi:hypothetical protein
MHYVPWNPFSSIFVSLPFLGLLAPVHMLLQFNLQKCAHLQHDELWRYNFPPIIPHSHCSYCLKFNVVLATDRHVQIRSLMKKQYPEIEHQFDVWHLANSVRKELLAKSKLRPRTTI